MSGRKRWDLINKKGDLISEIAANKQALSDIHMLKKLTKV